MKTLQNGTKTILNKRVFDRVLKAPAPGIASTDELFTLENGYYVNQTEKIIIQSTNETGKFFKKITSES